MKHRGPKSLAVRLSIGLAFHSLCVLALVCAVVYGWARFDLNEQQRGALNRQRTQLDHLFAEARGNLDEERLSHKLGDVLAGQNLLAVKILRGDGTVFFERPKTGTGSDLRVLQFSLPAPDARSPLWQSHLVLDASADAATLNLLAASLTAAAIVGAALISAGGAVLVRLGLRPARRLLDQIRDVSVQNRARRLDGGGQPTELIPLVHQFNDLLERLQCAFDRLEAFNADVAHELATPLSTLISSTEITLRRERPAEELREVLVSHLEDLHRLARIVQDMLFLAHADHGRSARRTPMVNLGALVLRAADIHQAAFAERRLSIDAKGDAVAAVDASLVELALSNLLANAVRHAEPDSVVRVVVSQDDEQAILQVENKGPAIPTDKLGRIFDRFYRADTSRHNADRHHGLGLSIVAAIAQMHGGKPFAHSAKGWTVVGFSLRLVHGDNPHPVEHQQFH